jgi:lysophospholipase L1-like esterase
MVFLLMATLAGCAGTSMIVHPNERIVFFGDSITELGVKANGYVSLIREELGKRYPNEGIEIVGAGISGNKVTDLESRLAKDILDRTPSIVVIYIGINDVWHWALPNHTGTTRERFEQGLREIIARIKYSGAEVILCTPSVIGEKHDGTNTQDAALEEYAAISRRIAADRGIHVCDLRKAFLSYLKEHNKENKEKDVLTSDGVHLNDAGNRLVADELLKFFEKK